MATHGAGDRGPRPPVPASLPTVEPVPQREAAPVLEIACPACATFNPPLFRYCPQCGHLLRMARLRERTPVHPTTQQPSSRPLVYLLWLVVLVETGLLGGFWWHTGWWPWATSPPVLSVSGSTDDGGGTARDGSDASAAQRAARAFPVVTMLGRSEQAQESGQQASHLEDTSAQHRYLADKRARAQRWEEALIHWQRVRTLEPALQPADAAAFTEAVLHASTIAQADGRDAEAHTWLLDAVAWVPKDGNLRLRLADSFVARGAYSDAIAQYEAALPLLPSHAAAITSALVRTYQTWGQGQLRQGYFAEATRLFRTALQLDSANGELYMALGQAEWRQRAIEDAIMAFEAALAYAPGLQPEVEPYLTKARALQGGPQTVVIDFPPGSTRIEVPVVIDGHLEVPCIVDTGATVTLLPLWASASLGYRGHAPATWVHVQTAGGTRILPSIAVSRLEIQGLGVSNLPVVFGDLPGTDGSKGLLGMDVLRYFALVVDHEIGRMTLQPK